VSSRTGLNDTRVGDRDQLREGNAMGRCLQCALSLHFEFAFVLEGGWSVLIASSFSSPLSRTPVPVEFSVTPSSFFEFLVILKARVTSSVYCSMVKIWPDS
jgi:hypothetical protein